MYIALLIIHGLFAVALLGALTHQSASTWLPARKQAGSFSGRFRAVSAAGYTNAIVWLFSRGIEMPARIAWAKGDRLGLSFSRSLTDVQYRALAG